MKGMAVKKKKKDKDQKARRQIFSELTLYDENSSRCVELHRAVMSPMVNRDLLVAMQTPQSHECRASQRLKWRGNRTMGLAVLRSGQEKYVIRDRSPLPQIMKEW